MSTTQGESKHNEFQEVFMTKLVFFGMCKNASENESVLLGVILLCKYD